MKNKILILGLMVAFFTSCSDLTELNVDKKNPTSVSGESLFVSAQKNLTDQLVATNVNFNVLRFYVQWWTETTYTDEANYDLTTRNIPQQQWDELYRRSLANLKESARLIALGVTFTEDEAKMKANKLAIIEILSVLGYATLVETFGNIPYTQALDVNILNPPYDDGLTVYKDLISRLNAAISLMDESVGSFKANEDNINNGDTGKWLKFANTLRLRMGLMLSDIPAEAALAKTTIEASAAGAILDNADNATMEYLGAIPNTNPLYADQVASNRQDYIGADTFIDTLNGIEDPRRASFFAPNITDSTGNVIYIGGEYGHTETYGSFSHVNDNMRLPTALGTIGSAAETEFLLAEAAEKGFSVGGSAAEHYTAGIERSMEEWGVDEADAATYLARADVAYGSAAGTWQQKVGFQAWIALYNRGNEAWSSWRRLDFPVLTAPTGAFEPAVPVRYTYPVNEQTLNPANYDAAATAIGGDLPATKLFFDLH